MHFLGPYIEPEVIRDIAEGKVSSVQTATSPLRRCAKSSEHPSTTPPPHHPTTPPPYLRCIL